MSLYRLAGTPVTITRPALLARPRRYPSDMTDAEWEVIEPTLPPAASTTPQGGHPEKHSRRVIVDAIRYWTHNGIVWRALPTDFPPWRTVYGFFARWSADGTVTQVHDALREQVRTAAGRHREPSAAIIDSQSVRAAETVPRASRGWDNAKKVNGRKRHIAVDVLGLIVAIVITAASVQDRQAARPLLWRLRREQRRIRLVWADSGYAGMLVIWAKSVLGLAVAIVRKRPGQRTFVVLPRRWIVERTWSWISRYRRTVRDYERLPAHHEAAVVWAMVTVMTRRLARQHRPAHSPAPALTQAA
jgi:putative transposase